MDNIYLYTAVEELTDDKKYRQRLRDSYLKTTLKREKIGRYASIDTKEFYQWIKNKHPQLVYRIPKKYRLLIFIKDCDFTQWMNDNYRELIEKIPKKDRPNYIASKQLVIDSSFVMTEEEKRMSLKIEGLEAENRRLKVKANLWDSLCKRNKKNAKKIRIEKS